MTAHPIRGFPIHSGPLLGRNKFAAMLDDRSFIDPTGEYAALYEKVLARVVGDFKIRQEFACLGAVTGRFRISDCVSLPVHAYRGRMQCKVRIGIPLEKCGQRWRMARRNTGDSFSLASGGLCPSFLGIDPRPFASRAAALKYARKLWSPAKVQLDSYGLEVTIYAPDFHLIRAVDDRTSRSRGKLRNFASTYGDRNFGQHSDHADAVMGALAALRPMAPPPPTPGS